MSSYTPTASAVSPAATALSGGGGGGTFNHPPPPQPPQQPLAPTTAGTPGTPPIKRLPSAAATGDVKHHPLFSPPPPPPVPQLLGGPGAAGLPVFEVTAMLLAVEIHEALTLRPVQLSSDGTSVLGLPVPPLIGVITEYATPFVSTFALLPSPPSISRDDAIRDPRSRD